MNANEIFLKLCQGYDDPHVRDYYDRELKIIEQGEVNAVSGTQTQKGEHENVK